MISRELRHKRDANWPAVFPTQLPSFGPHHTFQSLLRRRTSFLETVYINDISIEAVVTLLDKVSRAWEVIIL